MGNTYRYKFAENIVYMLTSFAKLHTNDDRHAYRDAWKKWWQDNEDILEFEVRRLHNLGYEGDVQDKMYKAGRYYFREKNQKKQEPQQRRPYISMSPDIIRVMDLHIDNSISQPDFTPAKGYDWFCNTHINVLRGEVLRLMTNGAITADDISTKVKKTYKNRYFLRRE
jgi:hypothetical protein